MGSFAPRFALSFWGAFDVGISRMQYQNGSPASPWVTGWLFTGAVALITSNREVRRRSSFGGRAPPAPYKGPPTGRGGRDERQRRRRGTHPPQGEHRQKDLHGFVTEVREFDFVGRFCDVLPLLERCALCIVHAPFFASVFRAFSEPSATAYKAMPFWPT